MDVHDFLTPAASLNLAGVLFGLLVVVNAYEEDVASIFRYLGWIFLTLDLLYGGVNCVVEFELYDKCWLGDVSDEESSQGRQSPCQWHIYDG